MESAVYCGIGLVHVGNSAELYHIQGSDFTSEAHALLVKEEDKQKKEKKRLEVIALFFFDKFNVACFEGTAKKTEGEGGVGGQCRKGCVEHGGTSKKYFDRCM